MSFEPTEYEKKAEDFLKQTMTTLEAVHFDRDHHFEDDAADGIKRDRFQVRLKNARHEFRFYFVNSQADTELAQPNTHIAPTAYEILACLPKHPPGELEDFCLNYGLDPVNEISFSLYNGVMTEWANVLKLFTPEERRLFSEIV